jgi:DNA-binding response OmpR family regulator
LDIWSTLIPEAAMSNANSGARNTSVLVVEDEFLIRAAVAQELQQAGYRVFEAADCLEALNVLAAHDIAIIVTDLAMPGPLDGNDLIRITRAEYPGIIVVAATGNIASVMVEGHLRKPYHPAEAVVLVQNLLEHRRDSKVSRLPAAVWR